MVLHLARSRFVIAGLALAHGLAVGGCGGAPVRTDVADPSMREPARLYPLSDGYAWTFRNDPGGGLPALNSILRVASSNGSTARVESMANGDGRTYERRTDGIFWVEGGIYQLRAPIEAGTSWPSSNGRTARVIDVDVTVEVPAGRFTHCVEVREEGGDAGLTVRTVYCPDIGPTVVEAFQELTLSASGVHTTSELQAYQTSADE